jgi:aliphatic sulfonates family ABC transporter substrate-binding protein
MMGSRIGIALSVAASLMLAGGAANAETKLRVGKAQPNQFAFVPTDIGVETGLFKKHGLDVEISSFGGDAKMMQALAADGVDIALGGGPAFAAVAKGNPMKAVAALANAPNTIMLVVLKDGPIKSVADLKGKKVSVSTAGSLTFWLTMQLSRSQGWGNDGIKITPLGAAAAQVAALKTHQIDGVTTDSVTVYKLVEEGAGRVLAKFGDSVKDFHVHVIYASNKLIKENPEAIKQFLAGWFDTIRFMKEHKDQSIEIASKRTGVSKGVATEGYNDTMPIFSTDGHFQPKALDVLATSFVETKLLPSKPDMSKLLTEAYLPK